VRRVSRGVYALDREAHTSARADVRDTTPTRSESDHLPVPDAIERVLQVFANRKPMRVIEATERAVDLGLVALEDPRDLTDTLVEILEQDNERRHLQGAPPRFAFPSHETVALTRWRQSGLAAYIEAHNDQIHRELHRQLVSMNPENFEHLVRRLLIALGFERVEVTPYTRDQGIDVRGELVVGQVIRTRMAVQVKRHQLDRTIGRPTVQQVRGSLGPHEQGLIITTSDFTAPARREAQRSNVVPVGLMNGEQLVELLIEHGIGVTHQDIRLLQSASLEDLESHPRPEE
jgi:restriction system protein